MLTEMSKECELSHKEVGEQDRRCDADRHYGFVYFNSVDTAEKVRSILLEKPEWKGNIAFARKKKSGRSHAKRGSAD